MKIGLFGGTFDPVHNGHLAAARAAQEVLRLDELRFLPAVLPPHKLDYPISSFHDRVAMLELAIAGRPGLSVARIEEKLPQPSFTIDTLLYLRQDKEDDELYFIIGLDAFLDIETWKEYGRLPEAAHFVVLARPPHELAAAEKIIRSLYRGYRYDKEAGCWCPPGLREEGGISLIEMAPVDISSSGIRDRVMKGLPVKDLTPDPVAGYIGRQQLYLDVS